MKKGADRSRRFLRLERLANERGYWIGPARVPDMVQSGSGTYYRWVVGREWYRNPDDHVPARWQATSGYDTLDQLEDWLLTLDPIYGKGSV